MPSFEEPPAGRRVEGRGDGSESQLPDRLRLRPSVSRGSEVDERNAEPTRWHDDRDGEKREERQRRAAGAEAAGETVIKM